MHNMINCNRLDHGCGWSKVPGLSAFAVQHTFQGGKPKRACQMLAHRQTALKRRNQIGSPIINNAGMHNTVVLVLMMHHAPAMFCQQAHIAAPTAAAGMSNACDEPLGVEFNRLKALRSQHAQSLWLNACTHGRTYWRAADQPSTQDHQRASGI